MGHLLLLSEAGRPHKNFTSIMEIATFTTFNTLFNQYNDNNLFDAL